MIFLISIERGDTPLSPLSWVMSHDFFWDGDWFTPQHISPARTFSRHSQYFSLVLSAFVMPITRGVEAILADFEEVIDKLNDEWMRLQTKKRKHPSIKQPLDALKKIIIVMDRRRGSLMTLVERLGHNCVEVQRAKNRAESSLGLAYSALGKASKY